MENTLGGLAAFFCFLSLKAASVVSSPDEATLLDLQQRLVWRWKTVPCRKCRPKCWLLTS